MADVTYIPDQMNQANNILPWMLASQYGNGWNNGGVFGGGPGFGAFLGGLIGSALPNFIGLGGNGGGWNNGNNAAAASLGAQATAIGNTETILRAIDGTDSDVRLVATTLNSDINSVKENLCTLGTGLSTLSGQLGLSREQIMNSVLSGDAALSRQLCECCCENRLLTTQQGYQAQIRTIEQTNQLGSQADRNTASIVGAINGLHTDMTREFCDVKEREMQSEINRQAEIITQLRNEADNARQTSAFAAMLAPINAKLVEIESKQPNTVPVTYPNITAVNNTPYAGGFYGGFGNGFGWGFGNGFAF